MPSKILLMVGLLAFLAAGGPSGEPDKQSQRCCTKKEACAPEAAKATGNLVCSLAGAVVESCCCVERNGGLHCTLADKDVETCCCQPVSREDPASHRSKHSL